ncbi:phosphoglycerol geranylgeranyltransferase [Belliella baltica DSM 15883]|uniref:Geranylgeranylglyceryl phosphate synthase n=1 Tax=Belliella baltica (strain DSM 15883 / CIP 108006 / LMG 21964 / BA134) TaxID=866536 RepID=I3Z379_BELBD|nr:geranylgeranylglyceryl/heptaprenylglyceryl phosphate synthase [Belliella baltica]AFL83697.1 phosphoglycerol geranylgeranyltransferase [Belliella baltica DSM 15883]
MRNKIEQKLKALSKEGKKALAWLIDPDKIVEDFSFLEQVREMSQLNLDFIFIGGSLIEKNDLDRIIKMIKEVDSDLPVILFPGSVIQFSNHADGILFLSLISGRNPDLLIGQHVTIAPLLAKSKLEVLPTGYMLVDGGVATSVNYISQTIPLPNHKPELAVATALAGAFLGLQYFYLDAGSGAKIPVSPKIIDSIKKSIQAPLIVGGGLDTLQKVKDTFHAGADVVVIGNGAEKNLSLLTEVLEYIHVLNLSLNIN